MRTIPTSAQLLDGFRRAADAAIAGRISPTTGAQVRLSWAPTSFFNVVRVGAVRLAQRCLWVVDDRFRASFLDTAEGDDLDAWAASEAPGFPRKAAPPALVRLLLTRTSTGAGTIHAGDRFSTVATSTSPAVTFRALADVPVDADALTIEVDAECETAGTTGNVDADTITRPLSALFATFTVTNPARAAGGDPRELDEPYRDRLRQRDARYRRGTVQAVKLGALSVAGVSRVELREPQWHTDVPDGTIQVIVGDARGIGSQPLADKVAIALEAWAASGITRTVYPSGTRSLLHSSAGLPSGTTALRLAVTLRRGRNDTVALDRDVRAALRVLFDALPSAAPLHLSQLYAAVHAVAPGVIRSVRVVALPSGTVRTADWSGYPTLDFSLRWDATDDVWRMQWSEE
jgi:uncharacterized phage protein gp47/JayE